MAVLVDIGKLEAMAMHHIFDHEVVTDPIATAPFKPFEWSNAVSRDEDNLGRTSLDESGRPAPGWRASPYRSAWVGIVSFCTMLEPVAATDQVDLAVAINVGLGQSLGRPDLGDRKPCQGSAFLGWRGNFARNRDSDFCTQKAS